MITIDVRWLNVSGIGTYLKHVVPGIVSHFPDKRFVLLGNPDEIANLPLSSSAKVDIVEAGAKMYSIAEQFEIPKKIPGETELFFAPHYNVPLRYRGKMLVTVYDLFHIAMPDLVGGLHKRLYARYMFDAVSRRADAIITISNFTRDEFLHYTGPARQPIHPIHLGVDESWFDMPESESPHGKPYILYVGNIKPHKNLGALVRAYSMADVSQDLVLVGKKEGFITGDTSSFFEADKLQGRVHFTGRVDDALLKRYMANADMLVFPSLYEGFGLPPLEAMAAGCPVISSNAASLPEICGDAAIYCDPRIDADIADKIGRLAKDADLGKKMREKGRMHARQFDWASCVSKTCEVMEGMLVLPD